MSAELILSNAVNNPFKACESSFNCWPQLETAGGSHHLPPRRDGQTDLTHIYSNRWLPQRATRRANPEGEAPLPAPPLTLNLNENPT